MNVTIQWSKGAPPILTIYDLETHDTSKIELAGYDNKTLLDTMMVEQGFRKRTEAELEQQKEETKQKKERDLQAALSRKAAEKRRQLEREEFRKNQAEEEADEYYVNTPIDAAAAVDDSNAGGKDEL